MNEVESILAAAMRLPAEQRAAVAAELLDSLDSTETATEEIEAAWGEEIQRRLHEVDAGIVQPVPWAEARRRIFAAAKGPREAP